jgi:hypothetical protein
MSAAEITAGHSMEDARAQSAILSPHVLVDFAACRSSYR